MTDVSDAIDNESALASERAAARLHPEVVPEGGVYSPTLLLYYKADSGFGAIGRVTDTNNHSTLHTFPAGSFATDWTHIVQSADRILYYNAVTGLGAIGRVTDKYDHETLRTFPAGSFATGWTHIVPTSAGRILYYKAATGLAAVGRITDTNDHETLRTFPERVNKWDLRVPGSFATGWTHIVPVF